MHTPHVPLPLHCPKVCPLPSPFAGAAPPLFLNSLPTGSGSMEMVGGCPAGAGAGHAEDALQGLSKASSGLGMSNVRDLPMHVSPCLTRLGGEPQGVKEGWQEGAARDDNGKAGGAAGGRDAPGIPHSGSDAGSNSSKGGSRSSDPESWGSEGRHNGGGQPTLEAQPSTNLHELAGKGSSLALDMLEHEGRQRASSKYVARLKGRAQGLGVCGDASIWWWLALSAAAACAAWGGYWLGQQACSQELVGRLSTQGLPPAAAAGLLPSSNATSSMIQPVLDLAAGLPSSRGARQPSGALAPSGPTARRGSLGRVRSTVFLRTCHCAIQRFTTTGCRVCATRAEAALPSTVRLSWGIRLGVRGHW